MFQAYRYKNKVNGKSYVGITSRPKERHLEHKSCNSRTPKFHSAIKKYGFESFLLETLKDDIETVDEACFWERYYIEEFDSMCFGYNLTSGGEGVTGLNGEKHGKSKLTEKEVLGIINDPCSNTEAAVKYNATARNVRNIRSNRTWKHLSRHDAPEYVRYDQKVSDEQAQNIISDPRSHFIIAKEYCVSQTLIWEIRNGRVRKHLNRVNAPKYINTRN